MQNIVKVNVSDFFYFCWMDGFNFFFDKPERER